MHHGWQRRGKAGIQVIVVGIAAFVGGAMSIPRLVPTNEKSSAPIPTSSIQGTFQTDDELHLPSETLEAFESSLAEVDSTLGSKVTGFASLPSKKTSVETRKMSDQKGVERIRVFYATDRQLLQANNPHLWITAVTPPILSVLITFLLVAGCLAGKRRWAWGLGAFVGFTLSFILVGQSIIKVGQLVRLSGEESVWFVGKRYEAGTHYPLHLGTSDVTLPPNHQSGEIERPSVFSFEFAEREDRHVMVQRIQSLDTDTFFSKLSERIAAASSPSAFVNIHGYNVQFDEALQRTAQITKDIHFEGAPILYSWPSNGQLLKYRRDESNVEWSVAHLERFLSDLHQRTGVKQIHVVAHSMGNRALIGAIQLLQLRYPSKQPMLDQVILAAPDVDADEFRDRYAVAVAACSKQVTLYSSANDRALITSMTLHGHRRLGLTSSPQPTVIGVDLIDVTPVDTSLLGHSYYGSHPLMIRELTSLLQSGATPAQRTWLTTFADKRVPPLWHFVPAIASHPSEFLESTTR